MASNLPPALSCPQGDKRLTRAVFGTYFASDLACFLFDTAINDPEIMPEWPKEVKNAYALRIQNLFESLHILCPNAMSGPSYNWCMSYLQQLKPDVVVLCFGNPELCDMQASPFHVASAVYHVAQTLTSKEFGIDLVVPIRAIPLEWGIPCTESKYRKQAFGFNTHMQGFCQPKIGFKFPSGFWKVNKVKMLPSTLAKKSFIPGLGHSSPWFRKYVGFYRSIFLDGLCYDNRDYEQYLSQFE